MSKNILIVYYSWSGNTRKISEKIHKITNGTIFELIPAKPYTDNYNKVVNQARQEIKTGFKPALKLSVDNVNDYNRIFIGSPNWCNTIAPPVLTFLANNDFSGKIIIPFCTHGGGGQGKIVYDIIKLCPRASIADCMVIYGNGSRMDNDDFSKWIIRNIGDDKK